MPSSAPGGRREAAVPGNPASTRSFSEGALMYEHLVRALTGIDFTLVDVFDILIVAYLIYRVLQFIRGTHAVQMALGALFLVFLYWGSQLANLETVNWLLRTFLPYLVFGIIVVFQAEIRKVLAHLGKPLPWTFGARRREEVIDEVVLACTTLAAQRTGAIMVLEREMGLRSYIETGIALDAVMTYDLLISIFNPGTPLHDGAVIIQGSRLAAAACFLPLTVNPELSRQLGSRHRAAIGVTEDTDAVAVVVSEETGTISLVSGGTIRRDLDGRVLKEALLEALDVQPSPEPQPSPAPETLPVREK
jgi:diadenylate cyclase